MKASFAFLLVLLLIATPVSARGEFPTGRDRSTPFSDPAQRKFLPANEAFRASAWRDDEQVYVGFINAEDYYLHRHQFALESRSPGVSFGELALPPGERMVHASAEPLRAASMMGAFGLGTLPVVLATGVVARRVSTWIRHPAPCTMAALPIIAFAVWQLWHLQSMTGVDDMAGMTPSHH